MNKRLFMGGVVRFVCKIEAKRATGKMVKAGNLPGDMVDVPFQFRRYARFCDSSVSTWPKAWWWQSSQQKAFGLSRGKFDSMWAFWEANLYQWRVQETLGD